MKMPKYYTKYNTWGSVSKNDISYVNETIIT